MTRPIADLDVPLPTLRERMTALVDRQKQDAAAERLRLLLAEQPHQPATDGDNTVPASPYSTSLEAP